MFCGWCCIKITMGSVSPSVWQFGKNLGFLTGNDAAEPRKRRRKTVIGVALQRREAGQKIAALTRHGRGEVNSSRHRRMLAPSARRGRRGRGLGDIAAPLRTGQHGIGVGVLGSSQNLFHNVR